MELDQKVVEKLRELEVQQGLRLELIVTIFVEESETLLRRLEEALAGSVAQELQIAAHTLKSLSAQFGMGDVSTRAAQLEKIGAGDQDWSLAPPLLAECRACLDELNPQLLALLDVPRA